MPTKKPLPEVDHRPTVHHAVTDLKDRSEAQGVFRNVRNVMVPTLTIVEDTDYFFRFLTAFRVDAGFKGKEAGEGEKRKPARVARVIPYTPAGIEVREHTLVGGTVLVDTLDREYPEEAYVGRSFQIRKLPKDEGVDYFRYDIAEIELLKAAGSVRHEVKGAV